jgi:oxygen-independent coproporphyrinogen-3 oxidase
MINTVMSHSGRDLILQGRLCLVGHRQRDVFTDVLRLFVSGVKFLDEDGYGFLFEADRPLHLISKVCVDDRGGDRPKGTQLEKPHVEPAKKTVAAAVFDDVAMMTPGNNAKMDGEKKLYGVWTVCEELSEAGHVLKSYERCDMSVPECDLRRVLKRQLYFVLSEVLDLKYPWGSLTGVRPTSMVDQGLVDSGRLKEAGQMLEDVWGVSKEKAALAVRTAAAEQKTLLSLPDDAYVVYVGIPFCPSRCAYCSFISRDAVRQSDLLEPYVDALIDELRIAFSGGAESFGTVAAVYVGGGTPTVLDIRLLEKLLVCLRELFPVCADFTVEAGRPDTLDAGKFSLLKDHKISQICLNPQTMNDETLRRVGRNHSSDAICRAFEAARAYGFDSINMDLIAGLPGEVPADFLFSVDELIGLGPEKITLHSLALKRGAGMTEDLREKAARPDRFWSEAFSEAISRLEAKGLSPYYLYRQKYAHAGLENVGFALPGKAGVYNVAMMSDRVAVLGFGSGATSKFIDGEIAKRQINAKDAKLYIERVKLTGEKKRTGFSAFHRPRR